MTCSATSSASWMSNARRYRSPSCGKHLLRFDHPERRRPRARDRLPPERRDRARRALRRSDLYAAEEVISESAIEFEHDVEESEDVVEKFKEFLEEVSPEDFAAGDS